MKQWLSALWGVMKKLWPSVSGVLPYIDEAEQVVAWLASEAGKRDWDGVENVLNNIGKFLSSDSLAEARKAVQESASPEDALFALAALILRKKFPGIADRHVRRSIELAYGLLKP